MSYAWVGRASRVAGFAAIAATLGLAGPAVASAGTSATSGGAGLSAAASGSGSSSQPAAGSKSSTTAKSTPSTKPVKKVKKKTVKTTKAPVKPAPAGDSKHLGDRVLREGMTGHDVRVLQGYLTVAGFATVIDGDFGPATLRSVIAFQSRQKLRADGVVTVPVEKTLRAVVAKISASQAAASQASTGTAVINSNGTAAAPAGAPPTILSVIAAANSIIDTPYIYGGGHGSWISPGYDCSGAVSFALHGGGLLSSPEDSTDLESYGSPGPGRWITIYADASHAFMVVAGRAFDTADFGGPNIPAGTGPRWRTNPTGNLADGGDYIVRHPTGY